MSPNEQARFDRLHQQHLRAPKRRGKAPKSIGVCGRGVRRLAAFVDHCPDDLDVQTLEVCFGQIIDTHGWSTARTFSNGIRFVHEPIPLVMARFTGLPGDIGDPKRSEYPRYDLAPFAINGRVQRLQRGPT